MEEIKAYKCDHCKKYSKSKGVITRHEKECYHNPITKACATCDSFHQEEFRTELSGIDSSYHLRPKCEKGISLFVETDENYLGYRACLKNNCEYWSDKKGLAS